MNHYEQKRAARIERLKERAAIVASKADSTLSRAHELASVIPFGQPIHIGHHSEGRDRRYRARIHDTFGKGFALHEQAKELAGRAHSAECNDAISSDDPDAVVKLNAKLAELDAEQERMRAANKLIKKYGKDEARLVVELAALGFGEATARQLVKKDCMGEVGFPRYRLANNGAVIRTTQKRIEMLEARQKLQSRRFTVASVDIVFNVHLNRVQILFSGKPDDERRSWLKSHGFRWAPSEGAWQAFYSNAAKWNAQEFCKKFLLGDLTAFDGAEVSPVRKIGQVAEDGCEELEACPGAPELADLWTVYGHFKAGHVSALIDCDDETTANECSQWLAALIKKGA